MNSEVSCKNRGYEAIAVLNMGSTNQTTPNKAAVKRKH